MLRRGKKVAKRLAEDVSDSSFAVRHGDSDHIRMTDDNATLESTVFGGESSVTQQLENFQVVTSGFNVSSVNGFLYVFQSPSYTERGQCVVSIELNLTA